MYKQNLMQYLFAFLSTYSEIPRYTLLSLKQNIGNFNDISVPVGTCKRSFKI